MPVSFEHSPAITDLVVRTTKLVHDVALPFEHGARGPYTTCPRMCVCNCKPPPRLPEYSPRT
jgi:hypothetical protein